MKIIQPLTASVVMENIFFLFSFRSENSGPEASFFYKSEDSFITHYSTSRAQQFGKSIYHF